MFGVHESQGEGILCNIWRIAGVLGQQASGGGGGGGGQGTSPCCLGGAREHELHMLYGCHSPMGRRKMDVESL